MEVERGKIIEVDSDSSEDDKPIDNGATATEVMKMCEDLEKLRLRYGSVDTSLTLAHDLRKFCIHLRQETMKSMKQLTLENWFRQGTSKLSYFVAHVTYSHVAYLS